MSKKHHYVPRGLLKNFAFGKKHSQVYVFDKVRQASYPSSIDDAGSENHFNTITLGGRKISFEGAFQSCDDRLAELAKRILNHRRLSVLSTQDRNDLAFLASIQFLRVKLIRTSFLEFPTALLRAFREGGQAVSPGLKQDLDAIDEDTVRKMSLGQLREAGSLAKHFLAKDWELLIAPDSNPFWISDNPIVTHNMFPYGTNGLGSEGVEISWPLGSQVLLSFRCPTIANRVELDSPQFAQTLRSGGTTDAKPENIEFYNSLQVLQSSRFIYASTKEFRLARRAIGEHPDLTSGRNTMFEWGAVGQIAKNKRMPMGRWLVAFGAKTHHMCPIDEARWTPSGMAITVTASAGSYALKALLKDTPHSKVEVYQDQVPSYMMREIVIEPEAAQAAKILVYPRDPGIRRLMEERERE
jgi:hypothetical protein